MGDSENIISASTFQRGTTQASAELHLTGGLRAPMQQDHMWGLHPVLVKGSPSQLNPLPIDKIYQMAEAVGLLVFGGDDHSGLETLLTSRIWTPLDEGGTGGMQPADAWAAIAKNAERDNDPEYGALAHHISFSLVAAGIRLRDASDCYHMQLIAAIHGKRDAGRRFANIPIKDLHLAFHSVLSELASARDYFAGALARKLGAPPRIESMSRFEEWVSASSRADLRKLPVVREMLDAYDEASSNPWLHQLTEYRNTFLHRRPLGSQDGARFLRYDEIEKDGITYPRIEMPLGESDPSAPGKDALTRFIELYRAMTKLMRLAADHAPYPASLPSFVVR